MKYEYVVYLYDKQGFAIDTVNMANRKKAIKYAINHSRYNRETILVDCFTCETIATYRDGKKVWWF